MARPGDSSSFSEGPEVARQVKAGIHQHAIREVAEVSCAMSLADIRHHDIYTNIKYHSGPQFVPFPNQFSAVVLVKNAVTLIQLWLFVSYGCGSLSLHFPLHF